MPNGLLAAGYLTKILNLKTKVYITISYLKKLQLLMTVQVLKKKLIDKVKKLIDGVRKEKEIVDVLIIHLTIYT